MKQENETAKAIRKLADKVELLCAILLVCFSLLSCSINAAGN